MNIDNDKNNDKEWDDFKDHNPMVDMNYCLIDIDPKYNPDYTIKDLNQLCSDKKL